MTFHVVHGRYSFPVAFATIAATSTIGGSLNYLISRTFLKDVVIGFCAQASTALLLRRLHVLAGRPCS